MYTYSFAYQQCLVKYLRVRTGLLYCNAIAGTITECVLITKSPKNHTSITNAKCITTSLLSCWQTYSYISIELLAIPTQFKYIARADALAETLGVVV